MHDEVYEKWADTFEIGDIDEDRVMILYHGTENIKAFKKQCKEILRSCVYSVIGVGMKIKISDKTSFDPISPKAKKNIKAFKFFAVGMIFVCLATAVIDVMFNYIGNRSFRETFYSASSIKVDSCVRVVQLSDLHGSSYGKDNKKLLERINSLNPDVIICTGDMVDSLDEDTNLVVALARGLSKIAPSYYIYGNNEVESIYNFPLNEQSLDRKFGFSKGNRDEEALLKLNDSFEKKLENAGIKVLKNEMDTIEVESITVDVYGVLTSNPSAFWSYSEKAFSNYINEIQK